MPKPSISLLLLILFVSCKYDTHEFVLENGTHRFILSRDNTAFQLETRDGEVLLPRHPDGGILLGDEGSNDLTYGQLFSVTAVAHDRLKGTTVNKNGKELEFEITLGEHCLQIVCQPADKGKLTMELQTGGIGGPVYGLGDHGGYEGRTDLLGYTNDHLINDRTDRYNWNHYRFISSFVIFPAQGIGQVVFDRGSKRVAFGQNGNRMGVNGSEVLRAYYFFGQPEEIYAAYKTAKNEAGYPDKKPKYEFFEIGYEAFGSLGWNTYQSSVEKDIQMYLDKGYPLKWAVVGSGFWKGERRTPGEGSTKAFGIWDEEKALSRSDGLPNPRYPDVTGFKNFFKEKGIKLLLGSRINFKALEEDGGNYYPDNDGPFIPQALERGYFIKDANGEPGKFKVNFPQGSNYILNTDLPEAVGWFIEQFDRWGADGIKEDMMLQDGVLLNNDGKLNPVNEKLMDLGKMVMVRNTAYGVPGDIMRLEDTKYGFDQDRTLINALNYAFSGVGNIYPDIVAGKYLENPLSEDEKRYFVRNAMMAAVMPVMSLGYGPWHMENQEYENVVKKAVDIHHQLVPYIYSEVLRGYYTGFPYAMTPLPLAFPLDENTYHLADSTNRQYSWLIGESLLTAPVFGNDYATAQSRDLYLPEGKWMDWETKEVMEGPALLKAYPNPDDKIPLWIGGKDVTVMREQDSLVACYFPLNFNGEDPYIFHFPDGNSQSSITTPSQSGERYYLVKEGAPKQALEFDPYLKAYRFPIQPGQHYEIVAE